MILHFVTRSQQIATRDRIPRTPPTVVADANLRQRLAPPRVRPISLCDIRRLAMKRKVIMCVLASAALAATAPLLAKPGGGGGNAGGHVGGGMGGVHGFGHGGMSVGTASHSGNIGTTTIARSNRFGSAAAHGTPPTGITNGMSLFDTGGAAVGTVTNISTKGN